MQILTTFTMGNSKILPNLLRRPGNAGLDDPPMSGMPTGFPMIQGPPSDDEDDPDEEEGDPYASDGLCALGQGIQVCKTRLGISSGSEWGIQLFCEKRHTLVDRGPDPTTRRDRGLIGH